MSTATHHSFHIPVMGLGFTIDTPLKVARFGISSVVSIVEDELIEQMRELHANRNNIAFTPIPATEDDYRAKRIKSYLNLLNLLVKRQVTILQEELFTANSEITKYFELLPETSSIKQDYLQMLETEDGNEKILIQNELRQEIKAGSIDVNIMSKLDKNNYTKDGEMLPKEYSDALAALRGFATSTLESSVVFSAGYNPRLYAYAEQFEDFFPDRNNHLKKKIILKVSDYRSALTQGKILAKKGLWVSEFRIESGLNCGGHAFATDGLLLGPILEEFKQNRDALASELMQLCNAALVAKERPSFTKQPKLRVTVQGGIGTADENTFLLNYYNADSTGWGSPFLLVPEATNLDNTTLHELANAKKEDYYISHASPLGVPFNNFRKSSSHIQVAERIEKGRPGSPCYKKYLVSNTEFTEIPICTASRQYLHLKIKQLEAEQLPADMYKQQLDSLTEKDCLCEGLGAPALLKENVMPMHKLTAVLVCPGPNLAYFSGVFSLRQMIDHIYGRVNLLNAEKRSNMFVNELQLYIDYFTKEINTCSENINAAKSRYFKTFQSNLLQGIEYYKKLTPFVKENAEKYMQQLKTELNAMEQTIMCLTIPAPAVAAVPA